MVKMIIWDMDGTLADLYGVPGWLRKLRSEDATPYLEAKPMFNMEVLNMVLQKLMDNGVENSVVTWLSKGSTLRYKKAVRDAKLEWLADHCFPYDHFHAVQYGATKADSVRARLGEGEEALLIDDNAKVRAGWKLGPALDPITDDVIGYLCGLLEDN